MKRAATSLSSPSGITAILLAVGTVMLYLPAFDRGFVSEDFLILRQFHEAQETGQFFTLAWRHFTGPWLGISLVSFFRPLSSLFLQIEWALFGTASGGYLIAHLAVHLVNAWQVQDLLQTLRRRDSANEPTPVHYAVPYAAAGLFALYPLHPNTVVFIASFATLLAVALILLCFRYFLAGKHGAALGAFLAALACYEQAAVVPVCLVSLELFAPPEARDRRNSRLKRAAHHIPFWLSLAVYLVLRQIVLGHSIGGYASFRSRLTDPFALLDALFSSLGKIPYPNFAATFPSELIAVAVAVVGVGAALYWLRNPRSGSVAIGLLGLSWSLISLAPFSFIGVVPGNGRYWYFAAAGSAIAICAAAEALGQSVGRAIGARRASMDSGILFGLLLLCGLYGVQLLQMTMLYGTAGATAREIRTQLQVHCSAKRLSDRIFVVGAPRFLQQHGVPAAQVFHWGLADAMMAPFAPGPQSDPETQVYPLPPLGDRALSLLADSGYGRILRWQDGLFLSVEMDHSVPVLSQIANEQGSNSSFQYRLIVVARGSYHVESLSSPPVDLRDVQLPEHLIDSMHRLYLDSTGASSPVFWWVEQRGPADNALRAISRPAIYPPA